MKEFAGICMALWFSGFFALGFVVHTVRIVFGWPVTIGGLEIPVTASLVLVAVFGALSGGLLVLSQLIFSRRALK